MKELFKKVRYLVEYIIILTLIQFLKLFGIDRAANITSFVARKIGPFLSITKVAENNIKHIIPDENIDKLIDKLWDNFGRFIGEVPYVTKFSDKELQHRVIIEGEENIKKYQETCKPFLLFSSHSANWEIAIKAAKNLYPKVGVIYRQANNPYIDKMIKRWRVEDNINLIAKGNKGVKSLLRSLKDGHSIFMLVDQKMNEGIKVPLLGKECMTPNAIAKLALSYGYPIIPAQIIRTTGSYFKIIVHPELKIQITGDQDKDCYKIMYDINQYLGDWIKQYPSQWLWFHNRWGKGKTAFEEIK